MAFSTPLPPNLGGKKKEREYLGDTLRLPAASRRTISICHSREGGNDR